MDVAGTLDRVFTRIASSIAAFTGQPGAFVLAVASIVIWGVTGPIFGYSDTWQLVVNTATTIITFLMVFLIQNSSNRDGAAMQAKLDELIRAVEGARSGFIGIEHMTDHQIEELRSALERECSDRDQSAERTVASLAERL
jgi:low affinity Fe/Cu permease